MKTETCYCRTVHCQFCGLVGQQSRLVFRDWHDGAPRFRCTHCDNLVGARIGTAYAGIRTAESTYQSGTWHLAEGTSIRATGRLLSLDKDTVCHWLPRLGTHCNRVMSYFFRNLHVSECQLDELGLSSSRKKINSPHWINSWASTGMRGSGLPSVQCVSWCRRGSSVNAPYPMPANSFFG